MPDITKYVPVWIKLTDINAENKEFQFRKNLNIEPIEKSITEDGQKFPVVLWRRSVLLGAEGRQDGELQLISGFRRYNAAKSLKWDSILAIIIPELDLSYDEALRLNFIENIERNSLTNLDIMYSCKKLRDAGKSNTDIGRLIGKSESQVRRYLKVINAPDEVQEKVKSGEVTINAVTDNVVRRDDEVVLRNRNNYVKSSKNGFNAVIKFRKNRDSVEEVKAFIQQLNKALRLALKPKEKKVKKRKPRRRGARKSRNNETQVPEGMRSLYISGPQRVAQGQSIVLVGEAYNRESQLISGIKPAWRTKQPNLAIFKTGNSEAETAAGESVALVGKSPGICYIQAVFGSFEAIYMVEITA